MKPGPFLLAAAVAATLLAGCSADPPPASPLDLALERGPDELEAGRFYAFGHAGGELALSVEGNGSADVVLFGADDTRLGRVGVGTGETGGRFELDAVAGGELVVQVLGLDGELELRSAGALVQSYHELPRHVERHILLHVAREPLERLGVLPTLMPEPADETVEVDLLRAPSDLRLLAEGEYTDLEVVVQGEDGVVLEASDSGGPFPAAGLGVVSFGVIPSQMRSENVRDGRLTAHVRADHFKGILLLEGESFSRARPTGVESEPTQDVPRFTYGPLPNQPVSFQVRDGTTRLYLLQESEPDDVCSASEPESTDCVAPMATVTIFDPEDRRLATVVVPWNTTMAVQVTVPGTYVAVLLAGQASLAADRTPADFELGPLDVKSVIAPEGYASETPGEYGQARSEVTGQGVVFRITPQDQASTPFGLPTGGPDCARTSLAVAQGGETIASWGFDQRSYDFDLEGTPEAASRLLAGGPLTLVHDDFGSECVRTSLLLEGYER